MGKPQFKTVEDGYVKHMEIMVRTPRIVVFIQGGVVQDVMSDMPIQLRIIDYDVRSDGKGVKTIKLPGSCKGETELAYVNKYDLDGIEDMEPFFKQKAIQ